MNLLKDIMAYPYPLRVALFRGMRRLRNRYSGSHYYYRTVFNEVERPEYGYCIWKAAMLAKASIIRESALSSWAWPRALDL